MTNRIPIGLPPDLVAELERGVRAALARNEEFERRLASLEVEVVALSSASANREAPTIEVHVGAEDVGRVKA